MKNHPEDRFKPTHSISLKSVRQFIDNAPWREATTYAETWPHEYVVRDQVDEVMFAAVVEYVRECGTVESFYNKRHSHWYDRGYAYWSMGAPVSETTILNRCPSENTYQSRLASGRLPK